MGLDMSVQATATSGQKIEIRRWRKNYRLMEWFKARAKARGEPGELDESSLFGTDILTEDVEALFPSDGELTEERFHFLENLELDYWDVVIWRDALADGFKLSFGVA